MSLWVPRRVSSCLAALGVVGLAVLPPEHVHLAADHDHQRTEVVHRHFEPHHAAAPQIHVENPDDDPTYLSNAFIVPAHVPVVGQDDAWGPVPPPDGAAQGVTPWHWWKARDLRVHDPPWARSHALRGPPRLLA